MTIRLRLLGGTELLAADGTRIDAVPAQPKRLALLAYLAAASPMRLHRRDALLLLFWPDADETHARGALSQSLSFLRRALGDDVIVSRGVEEVGVDPARIDTDVRAFEEAAEAGEHARALKYYGGDLLAGFHVSGCNEFDDWMSAERERLRERAVRAAKAMARAAEQNDDRSTAVVAAKHALLLAPLDESAAMRVLVALDGAGRPALALHEYEAFRRRLQLELGVSPNADLQRLAAAIRARSEAPLPTSGASPTVPDRS